MMYGEQTMTDEGYRLEDRPVGPGLQRSMWIRGDHKDTCVKTENGWICEPTCQLEEGSSEPIASHRSAATYKRKVDTLEDVEKSIDKLGWFKYRWRLYRVGHVRTFRNGRSIRGKDEYPIREIWDEDISRTKFGARRALVNAAERTIQYTDQYAY